MAHRIRRAALATVGLAATAGAYGLAGKIDRQRVWADPRLWDLADPAPGRRVPVSGADGTPLHVEINGPEDAPTVVLVHGWTCAREYWAPQLRDLGDRLRIVAYDLRGHGTSGIPDGGDWSIDAHADDLQAVLDATLRDGEKAVLVGHSLGAMTVVAWAERHPASVQRQAAAALLASTGTDDLIVEALLLRAPKRLSPLTTALSRLLMASPAPLGRATPLTHRAVRYIALSKQASPAEVAFCENIVLHCPRRARASTARTLTRLDIASGVAHLQVPTIVLAGDADRLTPPVHARRLAAALPQLEELVVLPGVGHMTTVEAQSEVDSRIERLVAEHVTHAQPVPLLVNA
ncbi:MAG: alpha/beta hydrolase fold protein [Mycobacterium sp.]|nr:alpha/beta hydrolase fold protein [Mycobacterium sp.]MCW2744617.1 alpha/beta hydrolase fold protein [Mycobacterium sp.]